VERWELAVRALSLQDAPRAGECAVPPEQPPEVDHALANPHARTSLTICRANPYSCKAKITAECSMSRDGWCTGFDDAVFVVPLPEGGVDLFLEVGGHANGFALVDGHEPVGFLAVEGTGLEVFHLLELGAHGLPLVLALLGAALHEAHPAEVLDGLPLLLRGAVLLPGRALAGAHHVLALGRLQG
jgi:hypothetical protein